MALALRHFVYVLVYTLYLGALTVQGLSDRCGISPSQRRDCHPETGANEDKCHARGCCWRPITESVPSGNPFCFHPVGQAAGTCDVDPVNRADCHPASGFTPDACHALGCCLGDPVVKGMPACYYSSSFLGYIITNKTQTREGESLQLYNSHSIQMPRPLSYLQADVQKAAVDWLRVKIYDPSTSRYEVPLDHRPVIGPAVADPIYDVKTRDSPFGITVIRKSTKTAVVELGLAPMTFANQYIEISAGVPTNFLYGFGERRGHFRLDPTNSPKITFWARDQPPSEHANLYGSHPFFLGMENDGHAFGVFLLNSNAMQVDLFPTTPTSVRYRTTGGILDFYIFLGPTPDDVIKQYSDVIGKTHMPPYWSLGFNLCKWEYGGNAGLRNVIQRMRSENIPYDVQWNDIDYMRDHLDWTYDQTEFSDLPNIVQDLHQNDQHYVIIVDPGIKRDLPQGSYPPYDDGVAAGIFIKSNDNSSLAPGVVWPGKVVYPDFTHPSSADYWYRQAKTFHDVIPFDGMWIDMNEPSNFQSNCHGNTLDDPPYTPDVTDQSLSEKTICPSSMQHLSSHYNLHSMYGYFEMKASKTAMERIRGKRSLVISRSTFPGSGTFGGHWTGDNYADFNNLYYSISGMLAFNMFGIPLVGADVCGFQGDADPELCLRWIQLGAFYPFMRVHRDNQGDSSDPASPKFAIYRDHIRSAMLQRYSLLPYLYTLFYHAHKTGAPVVRPLFFQYPSDSHTYSIDKQFMWGDTLLISPVTQRGVSMLNIYLPAGTWYNFNTGQAIVSQGSHVTVPAPLNHTVVHMREGTILCTQEPYVTTVKTRQKPLTLYVALDSHHSAKGDLYWDDGESLDSTNDGNNFYSEFTATSGFLRSSVLRHDHGQDLTLGGVVIYGVPSAPTALHVHGGHAHMVYDANSKVLRIQFASALRLVTPLDVTWN